MTDAQRPTAPLLARGMKMQEDFNEAANVLKRVAEMSSRDLDSEEDVKIKVVLPILRV